MKAKAATIWLIKLYTMRDLFSKKLEDLGHSLVEFGLHTFLARGASATAKAGIPDCLFKQHRRWKSDTAKDGMLRTLEFDKYLFCFFICLFICAHAHVLKG